MLGVEVGVQILNIKLQGGRGGRHLSRDRRRGVSEPCGHWGEEWMQPTTAEPTLSTTYSAGHVYIHHLLVNSLDRLYEMNDGYVNYH